MAQAVVGVGVAVAAAGAGGVISGALGGGVIGGLAGALASTATGFALSYGARAIGLGPDVPEPDFGAAGAGAGAPLRRTQMVIEPITTHKIVYGTARVGGPLVFVHTVASAGSDTLDLLHLVVVHAAHEVEAIDEVYLGDTAVGPIDGAGDATEPPWFAPGPAGEGEEEAPPEISHVQVHKHLGTADQAADGTLVAAAPGRWSDAHRLRGRAYTHVRLIHNQEIFRSGIPNVSALVRGRKVYDPRTDTTAWSDNAALCILDYLRAEFGLAAGADEIDTDSFIAAANICDESVAGLGGGSEPRYTCNGSVDLGLRPVDILERLLTSCAGRLAYVGGRWRLHVGAWSVPTLTLTQTQLRAPVTVAPRRSRRELINRVRGAFVSPDHNWQPTDYPPVSDTGAIAAEGLAARTLDLPFTTSSSMAQRIARIALNQNRREMSLRYPANLAGLRLAAGETVLVSLSRFGLADAPFRVVGWTLSDELGVDLDLAADHADVYAHAADLLQEMS